MTAVAPAKGTHVQALERDSYSCFRCGESILNNTYRILYRRAADTHSNRLGSTHAISNLLVICTHCTDEIDVRPALSKRLGYLIPQGVDPLRVPVLHYLHGLVILDNDGGWRAAKQIEIEMWEEACQ
jgi:hypothetical protein